MGKVRAKVTHQRALLLTEMGLSTFAMLSHWLRAVCEKHSFCTSTMVDSNISVGQYANYFICSKSSEWVIFKAAMAHPLR